MSNGKNQRNVGELRELANGFAARLRVGQGSEGRVEYELVTCGRDPLKARARCTALGLIAARMRAAKVALPDMTTLLEKGAKTSEAGWRYIVEGVERLCTDGRTATIEATDVPTFEQHANDWTDGTLHKKFPDHVAEVNSRRNEELLRLYIIPALAHLPIDRVTLDDAQRVMSELGERARAVRVARRQKPKELSAEGRRKVAKTLNRVMALAVMPCRYVAHNPIPKGWVPRRQKADRAKAFIFPQEDAKLLGCTRIPLLRRLAYGVLDREGMRTDELASLTWDDLDLDRGLLRLDENKTHSPRVWAMRPDVTRALTIWKERTAPDGDEDAERGNEKVFAEKSVPLDPIPLAKQLRRDLNKAGVVRPELTEHNDHRMRIRAHDLRGTFVTIALANGKTETWVADRTGHTTSDMINTYRRVARQFAEANIGELGELAELLPNLAPRSPHKKRATQDSNLRPTAPEAVALSN